jgi:hypothetical protein
MIVNHVSERYAKTSPFRRYNNCNTVIGGIGFLASGATALALIPLFGIIIGGNLIVIGLAYFLMAYGRGEQL